MTNRTAALLSVMLVLALASPVRGDEDPRDRRITELERTVRLLLEEVAELKAERALPEGERELGALEERLRALEDASSGESRSWTDRFTLGGYGEMHLNLGESKSADQFDFHRFVFYIGHEFSDWIQLHSELEVEHAFVKSGAGGELVFEQLYLDFQLSELANFRFGRVLTPIGIVNQKHEPPSFNGVERPTFAGKVVPSTWSADGLGIFGALGPSTTYEAYVVAGLDGSKFNALDGIRGGRIKERPSLESPAATARADWFPFAEREVSAGQVLRIGASGWFGAVDNGNKSADPGLRGRLTVLSTDFEYTIGDLDFRGAAAFLSIDDAREIGSGTANTIFGWYAEAAAHLWPDAWREGKLVHSDLVFFVRYEDLDTQYRMPRGVRPDRRGDRREITCGFTYFFLPNLVLKVDYQFRKDATSRDPDNLFQVGVGWQF